MGQMTEPTVSNNHWRK